MFYFKDRLAYVQYSQGISQSAYEESDNDCCVYRQLENVLLNPKTGIAKKRINGTKVSQNQYSIIL